MTAITPVIAVLLTMLFGGFLFWVLGKNPFEAIKLIFWDPLMSETFSEYARPQILVKASPLILVQMPIFGTNLVSDLVSFGVFLEMARMEVWA